MEIVIAATTIAAAIAFMTWTKQHLPIADFRPYKIGNHLPTLMEYPEDAEPDQYEFSFVYAKDGVEQTFTLENYPKGDSTWTFVRQESKLIKKGYEPPIHDFEIMNRRFITFLDEFRFLTYECPCAIALWIVFQRECFLHAIFLIYEREFIYISFCVFGIFH